MYEISVSWGKGLTNLFLNISESGNEYEILDYEFDHEKIHQIAGGRVIHRSRSGDIGGGYLKSLETLVPVGMYRVDRTCNDSRFPKTIAKDIKVMIPRGRYDSIGDRREVYEDNPVVIIYKETSLIYCKAKNLLEILKGLLEGKLPDEEPKSLTKKFVSSNDADIKEIRFYNCFGQYSCNPWAFMGVIEDSKVKSSHERLYEVFDVTRTFSGRLAKTFYIEDEIYSQELVPKGSLERGEWCPEGWHLVEPYLAYKSRDLDVKIVGWKPTRNAIEKIVERLNVSQEERMQINIQTKSLIKGAYLAGEFIEYELEVNKILFFGAKEKYFTQIKKSLSKKVRKTAMICIRSGFKMLKANLEIENLPDDITISIQDSLDAGNCLPGTQKFVDKYFPGQTETTAGELKKFARSDVRRVLLYVAQRKKEA